MAMIIVMILISQDTFVRTSHPIAGFIIVYRSQQTFPAASDLMAMLVVVMGNRRSRGRKGPQSGLHAYDACPEMP